MARLKVVGLDPSLRNWGIAAGTYDTEAKVLNINTLRCIRPVVPDGKQVRQNSKDLSAAKQLYEGIHPFMSQANAAFAEVPVGSQSARAMASYGICVGVLGSARAEGHIFVQVTADEVKLVATGNKTATKAAMIAWAMQKYPNAPWPLRSGKVVASIAEHMADAIAAIEAGIQTNEFQQLIAIMRNNGATP